MLSRTRQHDMRATIPARASWRLQRERWRGLAGIGIRRTSCGDLLADKFRELSFLGKRGQEGIQRTRSTHFDVVGTVVHDRWGETGSRSSRRSRPCLSLPRRLWPLIPCPCCFVWRACFTAARICFCKLSSSSEGSSLLTLGVACPTGVISCSSADSDAAASLCQAKTAEATAGDQWTSGSHHDDQPAVVEVSGRCPGPATTYLVSLAACAITTLFFYLLLRSMSLSFDFQDAVLTSVAGLRCCMALIVHFPTREGHPPEEARVMFHMLCIYIYIYIYL